jgi:hypothetical protein
MKQCVSFRTNRSKGLLLKEKSIEKGKDISYVIASEVV